MLSTRSNQEVDSKDGADRMTEYVKLPLAEDWVADLKINRSYTTSVQANSSSVGAWVERVPVSWVSVRLPSAVGNTLCFDFFFQNYRTVGLPFFCKISKLKFEC